MKSAAKTRLRELVRGAVQSRPTLPYVHSTDVYRFLEIIDSGQIKATPCSVFKGESLVYFFYGRPAYRPNNDEEPTSLSHYLPVCLILKNGADIPIHRIFPFDSGAFAAGMYTNALHRNMKIEDFELAPNNTTPGRLIELFYGNTDNYLQSTPKLNLKFGAMELEAQSYHALISTRLSRTVDNRVSGIEIQTDHTVRASHIEAAIVPTSLYNDESILNLCKGIGITLIPYRTIDATRPAEYTSAITDHCHSYFSQSQPLHADTQDA